MPGWIGVDFDGTLAYYEVGSAKVPDAPLGDPIPEMLERVKLALARGKDVRIFTARARDPKAVMSIQAWCQAHLGKILIVTDRKDHHCWQIWDDRAISVKRNTGYFLDANQEAAL